MWICFSNSSKQICIFQCHLDHLVEDPHRVHYSCRDSSKDNVKEFKDVKLLKSGQKIGPLHDLAFFINFLLYWAWNNWQSDCQRKWDWGDEGPTTAHLCSKIIPKHTNPHKTQNPEQYISFVWGPVTEGKRKETLFQKRWNCSEANPLVSHVLHGSYGSLNACKKGQVVILNQPLVCPRRQEMEEHFKNVEALIGIIF